MPPDNFLDHLAACAAACDDRFPGRVYRRHFEGSHGRSVTQDLIIIGDDGEVYQVLLNKLPKSAAESALLGPHRS